MQNNKPTVWSIWAEIGLTKNDIQGQKIDTQLAQIYEMPNFLTHEECNNLIAKININLHRSKIVAGAKELRKSRTCALWKHQPDLSRYLDYKISKMLGVDQRFSEPIQAQRYDEGEYFKEHTDSFTTINLRSKIANKIGGQRTWTVMVYLNEVEEGGETFFKYLNKSFIPKTGLALAWNNLNKDGTPNRSTMHEALPVTRGSKWIITKWFRVYMGCNELHKQA